MEFPVPDAQRAPPIVTGAGDANHGRASPAGFQ